MLTITDNLNTFSPTPAAVMLLSCSTCSLRNPGERVFILPYYTYSWASSPSLRGLREQINIRVRAARVKNTEVLPAAILGCKAHSTISRLGRPLTSLSPFSFNYKMGTVPFWKQVVRTKLKKGCEALGGAWNTVSAR